MFSIADRVQLKGQLVERARSDLRIGAAALFGSSAAKAEDAWSDIDLGLEMAPAADRDAVMADWSRAMYQQHGAADHVDVAWREGVYRVFLLKSSLQVDISFWLNGTLIASGARYRQLFGKSRRDAQAPAPDREHLTGMAWLYALHARSSIQRGRPWQAEYMIGQARDHVLALACARLGLPASEGRGFDALPSELLSSMTATVSNSLELRSLVHALNVVVAALIAEAEALDHNLAQRLKAPLEHLRLPW